MITEAQLDAWFSSHPREGQELLPGLVRRLVAASVERAVSRFPTGDSIGQHGADGYTESALGDEPFVPIGPAYWECGAGENAHKKATDDYRDLTDAVPEEVRRDATFLFVSPRSGYRDWSFTWKKEGQASWVEERKKRGDWKDVRVLDGTRLVEWLQAYPAVALWLLERTLEPKGMSVELPSARWDLLKSIGEPPPLSAALFLSNRDAVIGGLAEVEEGTRTSLAVVSPHPGQLVDLVAAYLSTLPEESRIRAEARWVIVGDEAAWRALCAARTGLVLVAAPQLDLDGHEGLVLLQMANRKRHSVVRALAPGVPSVSTAPRLLHCGRERVESSLIELGYPRERARRLAHASNGDLSSLLRLIQELSVQPEWAASGDAADLAVASLIGRWSEDKSGDREVVEKLSGNSFGEWTTRARRLLAKVGTPLTLNGQKWRFYLRHEGWFALGSRVTEAQLTDLRNALVSALGEPQEALDMPKDERYMASLIGKSSKYSSGIRGELAATVAMLGAYPEPLTQLRAGVAEGLASVVVRELLDDHDWKRWAALNDVFPALAEGAPDVFLEQLERWIVKSRSQVQLLFEQEGPAMTGTSYFTGILWALETVAWNPALLTRTALVLAALAAIDPGGNWANRPSASLRTILLPWLPQTMATREQRALTHTKLLHEFPDVAWPLLLSLLPELHSVSFPSRRPEWRTWVPFDEEQKRPTAAEYRTEVGELAALACEHATGKAVLLTELIRSCERIPEERFSGFVEAVRKSLLVGLSADERRAIWEALDETVRRHERFQTAEWSLPADRVAELVELSAEVKPADERDTSRVLFSERDYDLILEEEDYTTGSRRLASLREDAARSLLKAHGAIGAIAFAKIVDSPDRLGYACATAATPEQKTELFQLASLNGDAASRRFLGGACRAWIGTDGWRWIGDSLDALGSAVATLRVLTLLPFVPETWRMLEEKGDSAMVNDYWRDVIANPYEPEATDLLPAARALLDASRPRAAISMLSRAVDAKVFPPWETAARALENQLSIDEQGRVDVRATADLLAFVQSAVVDSDDYKDGVLRLELGYIDLFGKHGSSKPVELERRLAASPEFFLELLQIAFREADEPPKEDLSDADKRAAHVAYKALDLWSRLPGQQQDKAIDGEAFRLWLSSAETGAEAVGRAEVAASIIGQVLAGAPKDPSGFWIHMIPAKALDRVQADRMRVGFRVGLFNKRGVHWVDPTGAPEAAMATDADERASECERVGLVRIAALMRGMAEDYRRDAKRVRDDALRE